MIDPEKILSDLLKSEKEKKGTSAYGEEYAVILKQVERILPHADEDHIPKRLIQNRAPNATDEQVKYVKENWKATTMPVFHKLLNVIQRGFIDDNWSIIWPEGSEDMREYCDEYFPEFGSTETFVKELLPREKYVDANALLAIRPKGFYYVKDEEGNLIVNEYGDLVVDDTKHLEPTAYIHNSDKVLIRTDDFYLVVDDEKSVVEYNGKNVKDGRVLYIYEKDAIYKIEQIGKKIDNEYRIFLYFQHDEGIIPAIPLGGIPKKLKSGRVISVSPFRYATDILDLALTNKNYLQVSVNNVVFPFRIMKADNCTFADAENRCDGGRLISMKTGLPSGQCSKCNGTGRLAPYSPLGVYYWDNAKDFDEKSSNLKPVEFVEAPTGDLDFLTKLIDRDTASAEEILHLQKSEARNTSKEVTATETVYNDQGQISFVRYNVHQLFDVWQWMLNRIGFQRYGNYDQVPTLIYPRTFDFRSEQDIWNEIKTARDADAPPAILSAIYRSLINKLYSSSPDAIKVFDTLSDADELFALSSMAIAARKASNTIEGWQIVLHDSGLQLIDELIREDERYLELEDGERITKLIELAKSRILPTSNSNAVETIINNTQ